MQKNNNNNNNKHWNSKLWQYGYSWQPVTQTTTQLRWGLITTKEWNLSCSIFVAFFQWVNQEWYWYIWYSSIPPKNIQHSPTYFPIYRYPYKSQRSVMCLIPENSSKLSWKILIPSLRFPLYTIYPKILANPKYYYHHFHFQTFNHATGTKF